MIRVAWMVPNTAIWIGGLNYYVNLYQALLSLPERRVQPVLLGSPAGLPAPLDACPTMPCPSLGPRTPSGWIDAFGRRVLGNGGLFARELAKHDIDLLSHCIWLGKRSPVPALCWLADFQHRHLPHMFPPAELKKRLGQDADTARNAQAIVVSSQDARQDFLNNHPDAADKTHVLRFVAHSPAQDTLPGLDDVLAAHGIDEPYFHVPNQLWAHKNHIVVAEALALLAKSGSAPLVVSTGAMQDYRNPGFFESLKARLEQAGVAERFRFLGLIPYPEVAVLMRGAVAMINPSLFEGWSTTVEEAKSLGKRLILSGLGVHREQAPERSLFFDPGDAAQLAAHMRQVLEEHDPRAEREAQEAAALALPERKRRYALEYEELALRVVQEHRARRG